jgi:hypothetical protein
MDLFKKFYMAQTTRKSNSKKDKISFTSGIAYSIHI